MIENASLVSFVHKALTCCNESGKGCVKDVFTGALLYQEVLGAVKNTFKNCKHRRTGTFYPKKSFFCAHLHLITFEEKRPHNATFFATDVKTAFITMVAIILNQEFATA